MPSANGRSSALTGGLESNILPPGLYSKAAEKSSGFFQLRSDGAGRRGPAASLVGDAALWREELCGQVRERPMRRRKLLSGDLLQRNSEFLAPADQHSDGPVRLSERYASRGQEVRELRRQREATGGLGHAFLVEPRRAEHIWQDGEHGEYGVHRVEERLLVLLQIFG